MSGRPQATGLPHTAPVPPGRSGYTSHGCRCDDCRLANTEYHRTYKARLAAALADGASVPHGTVSTYTNWACRCEPCRAAQRAVHRRQRQAAPP